MTPFDYDHNSPLVFGGTTPDAATFETARIVVLPIPFERTTSYGAGTRNGPHEILRASTHVELWDEELQTVAFNVGVFTMPEMELPFGETEQALAEIRRVAALILEHGKFLATLGGEHSITAPLVAAAAARHPDLSVLQIDAHADLRDSYMGSRTNHACAMRRVIEHAPCTQVGIRSLSAEEAADLHNLRTKIFYDFDMRRDPDWIERVVDSLSDTVYVTIDCDGLDPAIMPAVGTPEPGGLSWRELLSLLRATMRKNVVACDIVELCPLPGLGAPNFLCARLAYKIMTYRFGTKV